MTTGESVVVGIDGSNAAIDAAQWAVCEAVARDVPLKLIYATNTIRTQGHLELTGPDVEHGEEALRTATAAIDAMDQPVKVEPELVWGPPSNALVQQSRSAALVCVGTVGIGAVARAVLGSTATAVAGLAHCSVAILRAPEHGAGANFVAVAIEDQGDQGESDGTLEAALDEARTRRAPLVAAAVGCNVFGVNSVERTERRLEGWRSRYPDVPIEVFEAQANLADFLADHHGELRRRYAAPGGIPEDPSARPLAVVHHAAAHTVANIVGPHDHALLRHGYCSVLIAR